MKIQLKTESGISCALEDTFNDVPVMKFDIEELDNTEGIYDILKKYMKYQANPLSEVRRNDKKAIYQYKDVFGNLRTIIVEID